MEEWKDIEGYKGLYQISNLGRVKSLSRVNPYGRKVKERILKSQLDSNGYPYVSLWNRNKRKAIRIHQLVGKYFISNLMNLSELNHIDGIKSNFSISNLEWVSRKENVAHAMKNGLLNIFGENNPHSQLNQLDICSIRQEYSDGKLSQKQLAERYNTTQSNISLIISRKRWKNE